jgi:hypothetical protein
LHWSWQNLLLNAFCLTRTYHLRYWSPLYSLLFRGYRYFAVLLVSVFLKHLFHNCISALSIPIEIMVKHWEAMETSV